MGAPAREIAVVTDTASMLTPELADRHRIRTVPVTIVVDGEAHRERIDITDDELFAALTRGAAVGTAAPSPGDVLACYEQLAAEGVRSIVSVHTGSAYSGVVNAVAVAAARAPVPVRVVDTASASFVVTLCALAAAEAVEAGGDVDDAVAAAGGTAAAAGSVFVVGAADLARKGGRFAAADAIDETSLLATDVSGMYELGHVHDVDDALAGMTAVVRDAAARLGTLRVGVGDARVPELGDALAASLRAVPGVAEVLRYRVGASVAVHTGPGTVGAVYAPVTAGRPRT